MGLGHLSMCASEVSMSAWQPLLPQELALDHRLACVFLPAGGPCMVQVTITGESTVLESSLSGMCCPEGFTCFISFNLRHRPVKSVRPSSWSCGGGSQGSSCRPILPAWSPALPSVGTRCLCPLLRSASFHADKRDSRPWWSPRLH